MIISASRRTDIPAYYSDWFFNRIKEGFVLARNPMNYRQISKISLSPDVTDGIVFWTKNPVPMFDRLDELADYMYYFQFTITPYGKDIEPNVPDKNSVILPAFKKLSGKIGADRVIWRYDPILINGKYTMDYHVRAFGKIAEELAEHTKKVTFSFVDSDYKGLKRNKENLALCAITQETKIELAAQLAKIAHGFGLSIDTCAEPLILKQYGIEPARCIDGRLFSKLLGSEFDIVKDKNQREECKCVQSIDIGAYNTCRHNCRYCYANYNHGAIAENCSKHNPLSPLIVGDILKEDIVKERILKSASEVQICLQT